MGRADPPAHRQMREAAGGDGKRIDLSHRTNLGSDSSSAFLIRVTLGNLSPVARVPVSKDFWEDLKQVQIYENGIKMTCYMVDTQ